MPSLVCDSYGVQYGCDFSFECLQICVEQMTIIIEKNLMYYLYWLEELS